MSAVGGAVGIGLTLIGFEVLVSSPKAPSSVQGIFKGASGLIARIGDPNVPAIPNRADKKG